MNGNTKNVIIDTRYARIWESEKMSDNWNEHSYLRYL